MRTLVFRLRVSLVLVLLVLGCLATSAVPADGQEACLTKFNQAPLPPSDCDDLHTVPGPYIPVSNSTLMRVPIVFHVITSDHTPPQGEIGDSRIAQVIQVLNEEQLSVGDMLTGEDGRTIPVKTIETVDYGVRAYNLDVDDIDSFFVDGILVHNKEHEGT